MVQVNHEFKDALLQNHDIQGLVISGHKHLPTAAYLFIQFGSADGGRDWLRDVGLDIANGDRWPTDSGGNTIKPSFIYNLGITWTGLMMLGYKPEDFSGVHEPFRDGITSERRQRILGDHGASHPDQWKVGGSAEVDKLHAVLIILTEDEGARAKHIDSQRARIEQYGGNTVLHVLQGGVLPHEKEHFGFRDGISQPSIADGIRKSKVSEVTVMKGEFVMGYRDEYTRQPSDSATDPQEIKALREKEREKEQDDPLVLPPIFKLKLDSEWVDIGTNGTYLVFRKLRQNVPAFWNFVAANIPSGDVGVPDALRSDYDRLIWLASKFVGRWPSGAPLALTPEKDDPAFTTDDKINTFLYASAEELPGYRTPISSHVRRGNPRNLNSSGDPQADKTPVERGRFTANRHQLIRRGMLYGPMFGAPFGTPGDLFDLLRTMMSTRPFTPLKDDGQDRGLLFFCMNANIARQFEFVQQTWVNNTKFHKSYNDKDPILGDSPDIGTENPRSYEMHVASDPVGRRVKDLPRFVTVEGGAYFFMPSISAIFKLAGEEMSALERYKERVRRQQAEDRAKRAGGTAPAAPPAAAPAPTEPPAEAASTSGD